MDGIFSSCPDSVCVRGQHTYMSVDESTFEGGDVVAVCLAVCDATCRRSSMISIASAVM